MTHPARTRWLLAIALAATSTACESKKEAEPVTPHPTGVAVRQKVVVVRSSPEPKSMSDTTIAKAIEQRLRTDMGSAALAVNVACDDGAVTLSGEARALAVADHAERVAEATRGVRSVSNDIAIDPPTLEDDEILEAIQDSMLSMPAILGARVHIDVHDGHVTLTGEVPSWVERRAAETAARQVAGVRTVNNEVSVSLEHERSDADIARDVRTALTQDVYLDAGKIRATVDDGRVLLDGAVGSLAELRRAHELSWVAGVKGVSDDAVSVEWWRRNELLAEPPRTSDEQKATLVRSALLREPGVDPRRIQVRVVGQRAYLTGVVTTAAARRAAERTASRFRPILYVDNQIRVNPSARVADPLLKQRVEDALDENIWVDADEVSVEVVGGVATLRGSLSSTLACQNAVYAAEGIEGIVEVRDDLRPAHYGPPDRSDEALADQIAAALLFRPLIDAGRIRIAVSDGDVTLSGTVSHPRMAAMAEQLAREAGAAKVVNALEIE